MLTYITHGCTQNASFEYDDLHLPCVLKIHWSMLTYITHGCNQNDPFEYDDLQKYVNLHHPVSFTYWNPEVCWLTSPMGAIKYASFEYADLQKYVNLHHPVSFTYWNPEVCWLASSMCEHDPMKYADLHHPFVLQILWSMLSYITFILLWFLKSWHNRLV